jgi:hypothetical protein
METTVGQMTVDDLRRLISDIIDEKLTAVVDPDYGLELRDDVRDRLLKQQERVENGEQGIAAEQIYAEFGLD